MKLANKEISAKAIRLLEEIKDLDVYEQQFVIQLMQQVITIRQDLENKQEMLKMAYSNYMDKLGGPKLNS